MARQLQPRLSIPSPTLTFARSQHVRLSWLARMCVGAITRDILIILAAVLVSHDNKALAFLRTGHRSDGDARHEGDLVQPSKKKEKTEPHSYIERSKRKQVGALL